jgi:hypothetical protein
MLNIYFIGPSAARLIQKLEPFLPFRQYHADALPSEASGRLPERLCAVHEIPGGHGYIFRAMACRRMDLQPVVTALL